MDLEALLEALPFEPVAIAAVALILLAVGFNKGNPYFISWPAQDEHVLIAVGLGTLVGAAMLSGVWMLAIAAFGGTIFGYGMVARFTGTVDVSDLVEG